MASDQSETFDRRSVLKTTGAALAAAVGASSTAAADHIHEGQLVEISARYDIASYTEACQNGVVGPVYSPGTDGYVLDSRDCYYYGWYYEFQPERYEEESESGWVSHEYVEPRY